MWLTGFFIHYIWLFRFNMTQKEYIKKEKAKKGPISWSRALKKVLHIMFSKPMEAIPIPMQLYSPFCYLPPGSYLGPASLVCWRKHGNEC